MPIQSLLLTHLCTSIAAGVMLLGLAACGGGGSAASAAAGSTTTPTITQSTITLPSSVQVVSAN